MKTSKNTAKLRKPISKEKNLLPSPEINEQLSNFREYHPASRLARNLRSMLIEFLMFEGATEANYLPDLLYDLQALFELLDALQADLEHTENQSP